MWLGKASQNDVHIAGVADGIFVTRSLRRLPMPLDITYFSRISMCPWECNYASLGHTLMHAKRVLPPAPSAALVDMDRVPPSAMVHVQRPVANAES